jgi:hypothetical protein
VGGGVGLVYVTVTNVGTAPCFLRGTPQLTAYDVHGRLIHRRKAYPTRLPLDHGPKVVLLPSATDSRFSKANANFTTTDMGGNGEPCWTSRTVHRLMLRPPSVHALAVQLHLRRYPEEAIASCGGIFNPIVIQR